MKKKLISVGIVVENPFHADLGFSIRTRELSISMSRLGCRVHVFSPFDRSHEPFPNVFIHNTSGNKQIVYADMRKVIRKASKTKSVGRFFYSRQTLSFLAARASESVIESAKKVQLDIMQGTQATTSCVASKVSNALGVPMVAGIGALLAEEGVQAGILREGSTFYRSCVSFVKSVLSSSDGTICVSEPMKHYLVQRYGADPDRTWVIPNGTRPTKDADSTKSRSGNPSGFTIIYAGILDLWERVDIAIEAMKYVSSKIPSAKLLILGEGRLKPELVHLTERLELNHNVVFAGLKSRSETFKLMKASTLAVLPSSTDVVRQLACPIKLFDYLSAGLPIVTTDVGWWSDLIRDKEAGVVTTQSPADFGRGICKILNSSDRESFSSGGAALAQHYDWDRISQDLLDVYQDIVRG